MQIEATVTTPTQRPDTYWLIFKRGARSTEMLTVDLEGRGRVPAVFSFKEEAGMFSLLTLGAEWRVGEITARELFGMLSGPYAHADFVALDPMPELVSQGMGCLVTVSRKHFVDRLLERAGLEKTGPLAN